MVRQALWTTWAEFIAYDNPRIASMAQFLLHDDRPDTRFDASDVRRWRTWQSGLATSAGARKPAYDEYPFPIHVTPTRPREGDRIRVFSIARPAPDDTRDRRPGSRPSGTTGASSRSSACEWATGRAT